jgi:ATP-dependent Lon protease
LAIPGPLLLPRAVLRRLVRGYTREAGLRQLTRTLQALCRKVALLVVEGRPPTLAPRPDDSAPRTLEARDLRRLLGPGRSSGSEAITHDLVGCAAALAWTPEGGEVLRIEVAALPTAGGRGRGALILTGQLGAVMQESAQTALSWVRAHAAAWGVAPDYFERHDLHLHVPAGAVAKDGPSAGVAMALALTSLVLQRPCRSQVACTGELTLRGRVLAVGGLREKLLAAARAGLHTVCIPRENGRALGDLPRSLRRRLQLSQVTTLEELLAVALVGGVPDDRAAGLRVAASPAR